ncbi:MULTISPECIES: DNA mismatch repair protein MutS [unclassified Geobacillus]|uniref:DNA mismatch repair protein MutS n=1 Tax=unclassified Geobacillus TaxID=2642459 RepID=UPI000BE37C6A|nr:MULTISPECIES: DNA mismatch repair protein MutS [unclassified Geobacillus]PDM40392.1 DNA mismatch repair protein MutS [Parageobacillus yumthangensis]PUF89045.1 DNA mismatch repair protein MutS [Geobacillus sp. LYN3]RDV20981.1 DNA mismatch repair protein MutS [Parageobacillus toebii]TXK87114.1 DNA mismatch repair protein MutS [Geobacillus sp. AYS3]
MATYTPMIQQYLDIKAQYPDAFLFFRLGDFYEMFFDDAIKAAQELEITLTSRDGGGEERVPMCGVPYHSAQGYIEQLISKGYKVAICEQVEDPKTAKGVVRREVVQLITPGTVMEGKGLLDKENNYLATVTMFDDGTYGFAYTDLSTGENRITLLASLDDVMNELYAIGTKEIVISSQFPEQYQQLLKERYDVTISYEDETVIPEGFTSIVEALQQDKLKITFGRLLHYIIRTQKRRLDHMQSVQVYQVDHYMKIDLYSKRNLELTETIRSKGRKGSLLWLLDETVTAMGGRLLKQWLDRPLLDRKQIERRLHMVETLIHHYFERQELRERLREVYDVERLAGRVAYGNVNARDLIQLKKSLQQIPALKDIVENLSDDEAKQLADKLDPCSELVDLLERSIQENPPLSVKEGNIIKDGYNETLDRYRDASRNGKAWIAQLESKERELTGIKSLKIGYNRVFGYYIEVTKANLHLLPKGRYERKQTLANAERFITQELKEKEALILEAEEKSIELEYELFVDIRERVKQYIPRLQSLAKTISKLDVLQSFATVSEERHYVKPQFSDNRELIIQAGRHPVVEKVLGAQTYVPNDCYMNKERELLLITGPNMSGKSTYMRQIALTAIMAQIGCFVPAEKAVLPIFDQVFTRIGAADDLVSGQSTFMVEMLEARNAIVHATQNSLILFDEIGRGTSTYDGMALAQAIIEYIHDHIGAKTLFSTHYHELTDLEQSLAKLKNVHVRAVEENGKVVFLHKIEEGPADQSYGIHVAELAELPASLIQRAKEILAELEQQEQRKEQPSGKNEAVFEQLSMFAEEQPSKEESHLSKKEKKALEALKSVNLLETTPLEALNKLYEIQKLLK